MFRDARWTVLLACVLTAGVLGCQPEKKADESQKSGDPTPPAAAKTPGGNELPTPIVPAAEPPKTIPVVKLSTSQAETCLVKVGDVLPEASLPQTGGTPTPIRSLFGEKLTVVCFWKCDDLFSVAALGDLQRDVVGPMADKGVRVVGVNVGDPADAIVEKLRSEKAAFLSLSDADAAYFAKVAKEGLPRAYLLDAKGKILWFDIGYQQSTRRDLLQGIEVALKNASEPAKK